MPVLGGSYALLVRAPVELGQHSARRAARAAGSGRRPADRALARLRRREDVRPADPEARARGRPDRERPFRRAGRRHRRGRARRAGRGVRADARAPGAPRRRASRVRRERLARAAHAALLAGWIPGAAGRRGARRADSARVPGLDARAGRPPDQARLRSARPDAARRGPPDGRAGAGRPGGVGGRPRRGVRAVGGLERPPALGGNERRARPGRGRRVAGAAARPDPGRERDAAHARGNAGRDPGLGARGARGAGGRGRRRRDRRGAAGAAVPALLPPRRHPGVGQRPRARDRQAARRADGRRDRARLAARAERCSRSCYPARRAR